jgi:hypothetical protein
MHFRDRSEREKFLITFAETSSCWRRVTVSCDYRNAPPDSLESELKGLRHQHDKCARIYAAIRDTLPDIRFYDTVTNLKLQTTDDGRLHVHVTEDVNETIAYPAAAAVVVAAHGSGGSGCAVVRESAVVFDAHLSGFVYKVRVDGHTWIKKEVPGPDAVDEFLYEMHVLHALQALGAAGGADGTDTASTGVVRFGGVVVDDEARYVKGLLVRFAERGALGDILYEHRSDGRRHRRIPWPLRQRWARQIVRGLAHIHEAGFVQGDMTLSNVVVDARGDAYIIDMNRRGCPVGWEPPELARLIAQRQKIGMYIGVKTDLFQLGMVLWALATHHDEPELQRRPLRLAADDCDDNSGSSSSSSSSNSSNSSSRCDAPPWFCAVVSACLSERPQDRPAAKELLGWFPPEEAEAEAEVAAAAAAMLDSGVQLDSTAGARYGEDDDDDNGARGAGFPFGNGRGAGGGGDDRDGKGPAERLKAEKEEEEKAYIDDSPPSTDTGYGSACTETLQQQQYGRRHRYNLETEEEEKEEEEEEAKGKEGEARGKEEEDEDDDDDYDNYDYDDGEGWSPRSSIAWPAVPKTAAAAAAGATAAASATATTTMEATEVAAGGERAAEHDAVATTAV